MKGEVRKKIKKRRKRETFLTRNVESDPLQLNHTHNLFIKKEERIISTKTKKKKKKKKKVNKKTYIIGKRKRKERFESKPPFPFPFPFPNPFPNPSLPFVSFFFLFIFPFLIQQRRKAITAQMEAAKKDANDKLFKSRNSKGR